MLGVWMAPVTAQEMMTLDMCSSPGGVMIAAESAPGGRGGQARAARRERFPPEGACGIVCRQMAMSA